jgi:hypothetical protein
MSYRIKEKKALGDCIIVTVEFDTKPSKIIDIPIALQQSEFFTYPEVVETVKIPTVLSEEGEILEHERFEEQVVVDARTEIVTRDTTLADIDAICEQVSSEFMRTSENKKSLLALLLSP